MPLDSASQLIAEIAHERTIDVVFNRAQGAPLRAEALLSRLVFEVHQLRSELIAARRNELATGERARLVCAECWQSVRVKAVPAKAGRRYYFQHSFEVDCPLHKSSRITQDEISARQFHGQQEGWRHRRLVALLEASIRSDASFSADVAIMKAWRHPERPNPRFPDLAVSRGGRRYAFELQVSNTSANVMEARDDFYTSQGGIITWITDRVPEEEARVYRLDMEQIHRGNVFTVDTQTALASAERGELMLRCRYIVFHEENGQPTPTYCEEMVPFAALNIEGGLPFYFDSKASLERAKHSIETQERHRSNSRNDAEYGSPQFDLSGSPSETLIDFSFTEELRQGRAPLVRVVYADIIRAWSQPGVSSKEVNRLQREVRHLVGRCFVGINLRELITAERRALSLMSLELGRPVGYGYSHLIQVAHYIEHHHPQAMGAFLILAKHYGREEQLRQADKTDKWGKKLAEFRAAWKSRALENQKWQRYEPEAWWRPFCAAIYPEINRFAEHAA